VNKKQRKVLINVGDGESAGIDRLRELASKEWPKYEIDIDAEVGEPDDADGN